jgi:hypothetical protein
MATTQRTAPSAPLTNTIVFAVAQLFDPNREPSHYDIEFHIKRCSLEEGDPKTRTQQVVGKVKRVMGTLSWAMENDIEQGGVLVASLISIIRGCGGFRPDSPNYVGIEPFRNAAEAFKPEGYTLTENGELYQILLDNLSGVLLNEALKKYVQRAKKGASDAALVTSTGKDILEATAAHILMEIHGDYAISSNFPTLLGRAFMEVGLATPHDQEQNAGLPRKKMERALYEAACAINSLRNKEGTGHGRPWLPTVTDADAKVAIEVMGAIAERILTAFDELR